VSTVIAKPIMPQTAQHGVDRIGGIREERSVSTSPLLGSAVLDTREEVQTAPGSAYSRLLTSSLSCPTARASQNVHVAGGCRRLIGAD
jgi:hypothetical protein